MLAGQDGLEAFLHQLLPGPGNRVDAGIQGGGDLAITPSFAGLGSIGFQQDARPHQLTCTVFALMDQRVLSRSRSSSLSFTMYFFTPACFAVTMHLRRCGAIDSDIHTKINDAGH
jgi:hypothetical protein